MVTRPVQVHKHRPENRLRSECWRENQAPAPTTDAAGLAESFNACGAEGKTGSPALANKAGIHLNQEVRLCPA